MVRFFSSLMSLAIALFFIFFGVICVIIPWFPDAQTTLIQFILEYSIAITFFGTGALLIGLAIVINILLNAKRRYYSVRSGDSSILVDEALIQEYLDSYWKQLFPDHSIPNHSTLKRNKIRIKADLPFLPEPQQKLLLERIKNDLKNIFAEVLGYQNEFTLIISFQPEK